MVGLDRDSAVGLRTQLEHQLREGVRSGTLRHDAPLPSTRALARELGVARGVVMEAYAQLAAEGYLVSRQGAPTRVAARAAAQPSAPVPAEPSAPRFDFRPGAPDVSLFPRTAWAAALRQGLREAPDARFSYSDPRGTPELRHALSTYLGRVRGVAADPETVMVTSGLTQGLALTSRALAARGVRRIAVEEPGQRRPASADRRGRAGMGRDRRRRRRARRRGARAQRRGRGARHARAPVPHRRRARPAAARGAARVGGRARRLRARGRLRRRVPLRPPARRGAAGPRPATRRLHELDQQDAGPALRIGWLVAPPALVEAIRAREGHRRPRHARAHAARADGHARARRDRPPRAQHAARLPAPARRAHRGARAPSARAAPAGRGGRAAPARRPARRRRRGRAGARGARAAASGSTASPRIPPVPGARA